MLSALSAVYGGVARLRRSWYERRPHARARLDRPVVSVGNMVVGGSGKTPVAAAVAASLRRMGHRPAVLSRGYGRSAPPGEITIVSDGGGPLVSVRQSGDEPHMLARDLHGVPVIVAADRYRAGREAIDRFGSTVLVLDDGFQHVKLQRSVDLLVMSSADLSEKVLPAGRLREPLATARSAHAVLVYGDAAEARRVADAAGVAQSFTVRCRYWPLKSLTGSRLPVTAGARAVAVAGIARPERFFEAVRQQGLDVVSQRAFPDHHWFTAEDVTGIEHTARAARANMVVTTAKDAGRVQPYADRLTLPWAILPLEVSIEPAAEFEAWLRQRL